MGLVTRASRIAFAICSLSPTGSTDKGWSSRTRHVSSRAPRIVVSIGCDRQQIPADQVIEWDAPMRSDDFTGSLNTIHRHEALARELALPDAS